MCELIANAWLIRPDLSRLRPKNILAVIVDHAGIGDVLMCTPSISALKKLYPRASITIIVNSTYLDLFKWNSDVSDIIGYEVKRHQNPFYRFGVFRRLAGRKFDLAIDFYNHQRIRNAVFALASRAPCRIGLNKDHRGFLFTHKVTLKPPDERYEADQLFDLIRLLGGTGDSYRLRLESGPENDAEAAQLLQDNGISRDDCVVCIHPNPSGLKQGPRIWPVERYARAADIIAKRYGAKIVYTGDGGSKELIEKIRSLMVEKSVSTAGLTTIAGLSAIMKRADLVIAPSTGPLHIAVAVATPTVGIFTLREENSMPERWAAKGARHYPVAGKVDCTNCDWRNCPDYKCVKAVEVDHVLKGVETLRRAGFFNPPHCDV